MTAPDRFAIAAAIRAATARICEDEDLLPIEVNDGGCETVAMDALDELGVRDGDGIGMMEVANLTEDGDGPFDRELLAREWPSCAAPHPLTMNDMDELGMCGCSHFFLLADGRFHDSEAPEGVANVFDLPILRRNLARAIRFHRPEDEAALMAHEWFARSFAMHDELLDHLGLTVEDVYEDRRAYDAERGARGPGA